MPEILEIGVVVALGAWVLTQIQLIRTYNRIGRAQEAIRSEIDAKRAETQEFVETRLAAHGERLEGILAVHTTSITALIPPNVHGELEDLRTELSDFAKHVGEDMSTLPMRLRQSFGGIAAGESKGVNAALANVADEAKAFAVTEFDPRDSMQRQAIEWINRPISKKATELEQMAAIGAKKFLAEFLMQNQGHGNSAVTYTVTPPRRGGSNMEM